MIGMTKQATTNTSIILLVRNRSHLSMQHINQIRPVHAGGSLRPSRVSASAPAEAPARRRCLLAAAPQVEIHHAVELVATAAHAAGPPPDRHFIFQRPQVTAARRHLKGHAACKDGRTRHQGNRKNCHPDKHSRKADHATPTTRWRSDGLPISGYRGQVVRAPPPPRM